MFGYAAALRADVAPARGRVCRRAARAGGRVAGRHAGRAPVPRDGDARPLGGAGRVHRACGGAAPCRRSSACTAPTSTLPRRSPRRGAPPGWCSSAPARSRPAARISRAARSRLGADPAKLEVVPYGVDAERFRPQARAIAPRCARSSAWRPGALLVFTAGRLVRKKGFEHLIDAWALVPPSRRRSWRSPATATSATSCASGRARPGVAGARPVPRQPVAGRRRARIWRRPTSSSCPRCGTTAATSTACPTSFSRRCRPGTPVVDDGGRRHRRRSSSTSGPAWWCRSATRTRSPRRCCGSPAIRRCGRSLGDAGRALVETRVSAGTGRRAVRGGLSPGACEQSSSGDKIFGSPDDIF